MMHVDVTFFIALNRDMIHEHDMTWWQDAIALDTDTEVTTWPEVYEFVARSFLSGGDYGAYVTNSGVDVDLDDGPDLGTDVKAPDTLEAYDGMP